MSSGSRRGKIGQLQTHQKWGIYSVSIGLWLSGAVWLYFYYFVRVVDQFGFENPHPQQGLIMMIHAVFALPSVWLFGYLWKFHIKPGWKARIRRVTGGAIWSVVLVLACTGYALYYIGNDEIRNWVSLTHWIIGLAGLVVFLLHLYLRKL